MQKKILICVAHKEMTQRNLRNRLYAYIVHFSLITKLFRFALTNVLHKTLNNIALNNVLH